MTSVLPDINLVIAPAANTPPQAAKFVLMKIFDTATASSNVPIANCDPPLNPNQPSHKINTPTVTNGTDDAANGFIGLAAPDLSNLPVLAPKRIAPANAAAPPVE